MNRTYLTYNFHNSKKTKQIIGTQQNVSTAHNLKSKYCDLSFI